jgi:hypothetical protein
LNTRVEAVSIRIVGDTAFTKELALITGFAPPIAYLSCGTEDAAQKQIRLAQEK